MRYWPLLSICALCTLLQVGYVVLLGTVTENLARLSMFAVSLFIVLWVAGDARRHREWLCYEFDFLVYMTFPVSVFWWTWRTRRWRGLLLACGLLMLELVPFVIAGIVWVLLYGSSQLPG